MAWFQTLLDETRNSYNDLITALRQRFASPSIQFLQRQELNDQNKVTANVIRRCNRLGINDTNRTNCFISDLNNELKPHVILNRPETFEDAESLARLKDAVNRSTNAVKLGSKNSNNKLINQLHDLLNDKNKPTTHQKEQAVASNNNVNVLPNSKAKLNF